MTDKNKLDERARETREKLIICGFSLLMREGVHSVSLGDILRYSDMKKGAFYYHFDSKEQFVIAAIKECYLDLLDDIMDEHMNQNAASLAEIQRFFTREKRWLQERLDIKLGEHRVDLSDVYAGLLYISRKYGYVLEAYSAYHEKQNKWIRESLLFMQQEGTISADIDCAEFAKLVEYACEGVLVMWQNKFVPYGEELKLVMRNLEALSKK